MKRILILLLIISTLSSCNNIKQKKSITKFKVTENQVKQDTIYNYWELIFDTISNKRKVEISNLNQTLIIKTFSLNDNSIVRNLGQNGSQVYLDHSHKMVTDLMLFNDSISNKKRIDRTDFKESLFPEFYKECNLYTSEIDSLVGNTIYLKSDLAIPDSDNQWRVWYSIEIMNHQFGNIKIIKTDYVGL